MSVWRLAALGNMAGWTQTARGWGLRMGVHLMGNHLNAEDSLRGTSSFSNIAAEHLMVLPMPKLSHAMTSGRIVKWHIKEGGQVSMYDVLLTVETESLVEEAYRVDQFAGKVALLVESQEEAFVARLLAAEGEEVPVGRPIALLCERAEEISTALESTDRITGVSDVYNSSQSTRLRLLEWQSYLAQGPPSNGCL